MCESSGFWFLSPDLYFLACFAVQAALRKADVMKIAKLLTRFVLFVHCLFQFVDLQTFFNEHVHHITAVVNGFETVFKFTAGGE